MSELRIEDFLRRAERLEEQGSLESAFSCLLAGAQAGHTGCQVNLATFLSEGKGTAKDLRSAAKWYKQASRQGERCAAHNLAIDYRNLGNSRAAIAWCKRAIALEDGDACVELSKLSLQRRGGKRHAMRYLKQALRMSRDSITESGKEEAAQLICTLETGE